MSGLDLGLAGRSAVVCGSSSGLGKACAAALARSGVNVTINGRSQAPLHEAVRELEAISGMQVASVCADVTTSEGRGALLDACPEPDILVNNSGGPPPGDFANWSEQEWMNAIRANMISPIQLIRATVPAMKNKGWGRIINITSSAVKAPLPLLGLSNGARAGLTGVVAGLARELACFGITINNLLPGTFATDRLRKYAAALAQRDCMSPEDVWTRLETQNPTKRIGDPAEFGATCAFIASNHAGYINGQNILLDGGAYPGAL